MDWKVTLGIAFAMAVYITVGGVIFWVIESKDQEPPEKNNITDVIYSLLGNASCLSEQQLQGVVDKLRDTFGDYVDQTEDPLDVHDWIFFAITVVTTIGYGNLTPQTSAGKAVCSVYAIIGVPLCLLLLVKIGLAITEVTSKIEKRISDRYPAKLKGTKTALITALGLGVFLFLPAVVFMYLQRWSYGTALYFSVISLLTIGFGDYVAGVDYVGEYQALYRIMVGVWLFLGLAWVAGLVSSIQDTYTAAVKKVEAIDMNLPSAPQLPSFPLSSISKKKSEHANENHGKYNQTEVRL